MDLRLTRNDLRLLFKIGLIVAVFAITIAAMGGLLGSALQGTASDGAANGHAHSALS